MNIIEARNLTKTFKEGRQTVRSLNDVTFDIAQGEIVGLLGPDGAGKTTLMRLLCGLFRPTAGTANVFGWDIVQQGKRIQDNLGYVPQKFGLYENMTVAENLNLYAKLHAVSREEFDARFPRLMEMTNLGAFTQRRAGKLSGGMKQKLALACALVSRPKLMLLDEPTVGVDILSRRELWDILRSIVQTEGMTVMASTSYMDEADFCDRTLVLFEGKLIANSDPKEIRDKAKSCTATPTFEQGFQFLLNGSIPEPLKRKNPVKKDAPVLIRVENLVKRFGSFKAVNDVSFNVRKGEIFGLLGANGAGKTTTFRAMCGLSAATSGAIEIAGVDLAKNTTAAWSQIGFVAQKFSLYSDLTVMQNMEFFGGVYGLKGAKKKERIQWGLNTFDLAPLADRDAGKLSMGFKRRLSMACALLHEPPILFLDEATSGADPVARHEFWKIIMELADSGVSVIITTHFLDEAAYCDRMIIMQDGAAVAMGTVEDIIRQGKDAPNLEEAFVQIIQEKRK
ncbi:MAG: ATP-binding cassette domain-containing protein [Thermoguttaceae bacterium]|nr:ATP-binding cassette domain-containing protein [Thermoguttaceae bacterium]